jgi:D-aminoacyl-tRNA deacylase
MRVLLQRVRRASVSVDDVGVSAIDSGLVALVGIGHEDSVATVERVANKVIDLRIFEDDAGKMNRSLRDLSTEAPGAGMLVISQFTLYADIRKGRRPGFSAAAQPEIAQQLVAHFTAFVSAAGIIVECGEFGAHMVVSLENDGPVTIWVDSNELSGG